MWRWIADRGYDTPRYLVCAPSSSLREVRIYLVNSRGAATDDQTHIEAGRFLAKNGCNMIWTTEQDQFLIDQINAGRSYSLVCAELGITRSAAIGRGRRLGLSKPAKQLAADESIVSRKSTIERYNSKKRLERTNKILIAGGNVRSVYRACEIEKLRAATINPKCISFAELKPSDCRYPFGGGGKPTTFCGHPQLPGKSYCAAHFALCWREPAKRVSAKQTEMAR